MATSRTANRRSTNWIGNFGVQEIAALALGCLAVMLLLALISYSPYDLPGWVPFAKSAAIEVGAQNLVGPFGALIAGYAYFFFGAASYLLPAVFLWWAFQVFSTGRFLSSRNYVAFALFIISATCLIEYQSVLFQNWVQLYNLPKSSGGLFGYLVGRRLIGGLIGSAGIFMVSATTYCISLIVITGIHPVRLLRLIIERSTHYWQTLGQNPEPIVRRSKPSQVKIHGEQNYVPRKVKPTLDTLEWPEFEPEPVANKPSPERVRKIVDASQGQARTVAQPIVKAKKNTIHFEGYQLPSLDLLGYPEQQPTATDRNVLIHVQDTIVSTLSSFGVEVEPGDITKGPTITRYEVYPSPGLRVNRITSLEADIARATRAERINILAPIPGKDTVGIEIANTTRVTVALRELFEDAAFSKSTAQLPLALGKDVYGETIVADLAKMPHLLVAGATGSGKSVCINSIIASLLYRFTPDQLKLIMVDPKVVEMQLYNSLPHMVVPVVTEPKKALIALKWVIGEMENRYRLFAKREVRSFEGYNELRADELRRGEPGIHEDEPESLPFIVVIIDELADLMQTAPTDVEACITRIAQKARAAGIHLVVATQSPRADVVTGIIKANIPSRIAFQVASKTDSRIILDENGAENLVGKGDMLYLPPGSARVIRAQGALITDAEAQAIVASCAACCAPDFSAVEATQAEFDYFEKSNENDISDADEALIERCIEVIIAEGRASTSLLQRRLRIGYARAARMVDILESRGIVGPGDGAKPREILVDLSGE